MSDQDYENTIWKLDERIANLEAEVMKWKGFHSRQTDIAIIQQAAIFKLREGIEDLNSYLGCMLDADPIVVGKVEALLEADDE